MRYLSIFFLLTSATALAGPPFLTDDPEPVDYHHYEFYVFSILDKNNVAIEEPQLAIPAVEFNWGAIPNVQLHVAIPYAFSLPNAAPAANGLGDIEAGLKFRFIQEASNRPQVGIYPLFELPTGDVNRNLGNGKLWMKLPLWLQKSWGSWKTYGGAGYALNSAKDMRNYPFGGWLLQKDLNEKLTLGAELFSQGAVSTQSHSYTIFNVGGNYNFSKNFSLLFSVGRTVLGEEHTNGYVALYWTWG